MIQEVREPEVFSGRARFTLSVCNQSPVVQSNTSM